MNDERVTRIANLLKQKHGYIQFSSRHDLEHCCGTEWTMAWRYAYMLNPGVDDMRHFTSIIQCANRCAHSGCRFCIEIVKNYRAQTRRGTFVAPWPMLMITVFMLRP
jgi:hypothetical protein